MSRPAFLYAAVCVSLAAVCVTGAMAHVPLLLVSLAAFCWAGVRLWEAEKVRRRKIDRFTWLDDEIRRTVRRRR